MKRKQKEVEGILFECETTDKPLFVRYKNGAQMYSMSVNQFIYLAKEANAVYKINKMVLVNCLEFERFLEYYRV